MTTEEKLQHFEEAAVERAKAKREAAIAEHQAALEKIEAEHMAETDRRAALQIKTETENLNRSINTALSKEQLQIRREISQKNDELKEKLFVEIKTQLEEYMSTPAYVKLLEKQIKDILKVAGGEHVTIYIDPNDQFLLQDLAAATNTAISVSEYSFMGGTRAVLEERHMLIDNSFETKLTEAKEQFTFSGGVSHE